MYNIRFTERALIKLDEIPNYIAYILFDPFAAEKYYNDIFKAAYSLEHFPNRGSLLGHDELTNRDYRKIFVHNYTIIYYVEGDTVYIVDILYSASDIASKFEGEVNGNF